MGTCKICDTTSESISKELGVCLECIRKQPKAALKYALEAHRRSREAFGLPEKPPKDPNGIPCRICVHECQIPEGEVGYCGLRRNDGGKIKEVSPKRGKLSWYHDPLPTNCVGDWVCAGCTGAGYPNYSHCPGPEYGYKNLAVFFHACSFNCLYCQNWQFKKQTPKPQTRTAEKLADAVDDETTCICYFGGDPTPQLPFSIRASKLALEKKKGKMLRVCWETNGSMDAHLLDRIMDMALESGGCVKFDLKAWDENLHIALTGVTNKRTLENFKRAGEKTRLRPDPPLLIASTLLVPGYIDEVEIRSISRFIAQVNPDIPYALLGFYPQFYMKDLPRTPRVLAEKCQKIAYEEGLKNVKIGNIRLLT